ncbi:Na(+)/H(+) antiporter subunit C [Rubripirellula obstinata]|uniref:Na(+)/H(+) antiporter subunit C n=1 Tax=Rubripirellula obstinata TaxID=406547 RepID=A0A5B1CRJ3_9BACT|nr:NADH-quinone oxidoreductase subunit K [Rubripirellula obstinata]KAA1262003.1 Na(+)/H(+) antiporter subunit C [Rubripirellula obstinata]
MTYVTMYALTGTVLIGVGLFGTTTCSHLLRKIIGLNVMGAGTFLVLIALARRTTDPLPDPVPHAMVLTGIVVAVSASALALALLRRYYRETGRTDLKPTLQKPRIARKDSHES